MAAENHKAIIEPLTVNMVVGACADIPVPASIPYVESLRPVVYKFCLKKWRERQAERSLGDVEDLSNGCKFVSLFCLGLFGGFLEGNYDHQFNRLLDGSLLDINEGCQDVQEMIENEIEPYDYDLYFFGNNEHIDSMAGCLERVNKWLVQFQAEHLSTGKY